MNRNWGWFLIIFGAFSLIQGLIGADLDIGSDTIDPSPKQYYVLSPRMKMFYKGLGLLLILVGCARLLYKWVVWISVSILVR